MSGFRLGLSRHLASSTDSWFGPAFAERGKGPFFASAAIIGCGSTSSNVRGGGFSSCTNGDIQPPRTELSEAVTQAFSPPRSRAVFSSSGFGRGFS